MLREPGTDGSERLGCHGGRRKAIHTVGDLVVDPNVEMDPVLADLSFGDALKAHLRAAVRCRDEHPLVALDADLTAEDVLPERRQARRIDTVDHNLLQSSRPASRYRATCEHAVPGIGRRLPPSRHQGDQSRSARQRISARTSAVGVERVGVHRSRRRTRTSHGARGREFYSRYSNPTVRSFEEAIAELEGADDALAFASGMGALASTVLAICSSGDHIVAQRQLYAGTIAFLQGPCQRLGIDLTLVDGVAPGAFAAAVRPGRTMLVLAETPSNPRLELVDLDELAAIRGPLTVVDSTFATPLGQQPLAHGVDLVVHSATKGIAGHNDATLGVIAGEQELLDAIWSYSVLHGATPSPFDALNALRGVRTLAVRTAHQTASAQRIAEWLVGPSVGRGRPLSRAHHASAARPRQAPDASGGHGAGVRAHRWARAAARSLARPGKDLSAWPRRSADPRRCCATLRRRPT